MPLIVKLIITKTQKTECFTAFFSLRNRFDGPERINTGECFCIHGGGGEILYNFGSLESPKRPMFSSPYTYVLIHRLPTHTTRGQQLFRLCIIYIWKNHTAILYPSGGKTRKSKNFRKR